MLWIIPTVFYLISLCLWGYGYRYALALPIEKVFIGFIGFCEPFQNPLIGMLIGMGILFAFHMKKLGWKIIIKQYQELLLTVPLLKHVTVVSICSTIVGIYGPNCIHMR